MAFEFSFHGIPFRIPSAEQMEMIEAAYPFSEVTDIVSYAVGSHPRDEFGLAAPPPPPPLRIHQYFKPTGARRWGVMRGLMHVDDVEAIIPGTMTGSSGGNLVIDDGSGGDRIIEIMHAIAARPVVGVDGVDDLFLVTFVDGRYFYRNHHLTSAFVPGAGEGWDTARLTFGLPAPTPAFESVYLGISPDSPFTQLGVRWASAQDAIAASTGRMVVWRTSGGGATVGPELVRYETANVDARARAETLLGDNSAGGYLFDGNPDVWTANGANMEIWRRSPRVPSRIHVAMPIWAYAIGDDPSVAEGAGHYVGYYNDFIDWGNQAPTYCTMPQSFTDGPEGAGGLTYTPGDLGAPYDTWTAGPEEIRLYSALKLRIDYAGPDGTHDYSLAYNYSDATALAEQLCKDYLESINCNIDAIYNGTIEFDAGCGLDLLYTWEPGRITTRVMARPLNTQSVWLWHGDDQRPSQRLFNERWPFAKYTGDIVSPEIGGPSVDLSWCITSADTFGLGLYLVHKQFTGPGIFPAPAPGFDSTYGASVGSRYYDTTFGSETEWVCLNASPGAAVWKKTIPVGGILSVPEGGTGASSLTSGGILLGGGVGPITATTAGRVGGTGGLEIQLSGTRWLRSGVASF